MYVSNEESLSISKVKSAFVPSEHKNLPRHSHPLTNHPQFSYKKNKLENGHKKKSTSKSKSGRKFVSGNKRSSIDSKF